MMGKAHSEDVVLVQHRGGVGYIVLNRPEVMNAISLDMAVLLQEVLRGLADDPGVKVIVIRGAGGNFSVGGDFKEVERLRAQGDSALTQLFAIFGRACTLIETLGIPVVAVVEGYAMAGGFELLLASDIVLVRDDAVLADNHANFGQIPGGGSSQRLPRLVGRQRALGLMLSGNRLTGVEAVDWGLAYQSYPPEQFESGVETFVESLAAKSPEALTIIKDLVYRGAEMSLTNGLATELGSVMEFIAGDAGAAGIEQFKTREG
jgi:enoyl-CoA hydratase/carnithine racemase